jgi:hypothetical protein
MLNLQYWFVHGAEELPEERVHGGDPARDAGL